MASLPEMEIRLEKIADAIKETEKRLPAHSVKPPVMMDLLALEDEYARLLKQIQELKQERSKNRAGFSGNPPKSTLI